MGMWKSYLPIALQHLGMIKNIRYIMGSSPLAFFWPQSTVNGTGLEYPVAEGTGKWIEFHNEPRDGPSSVTNEFGDAAASRTLDDRASSASLHSNALANDQDAIRSRRNGRESDNNEGMTMV